MSPPSSVAAARRRDSIERSLGRLRAILTEVNPVGPTGSRIVHLGVESPA